MSLIEGGNNGAWLESVEGVGVQFPHETYEGDPDPMTSLWDKTQPLRALPGDFWAKANLQDSFSTPGEYIVGNLAPRSRVLYDDVTGIDLVEWTVDGVPVTNLGALLVDHSNWLGLGPGASVHAFDSGLGEGLMARVAGGGTVVAIPAFPTAPAELPSGYQSPYLAAGGLFFLATENEPDTFEDGPFGPERVTWGGQRSVWGHLTSEGWVPAADYTTTEPASYTQRLGPVQEVAVSHDGTVIVALHPVLERASADPDDDYWYQIGYGFMQMDGTTGEFVTGDRLDLPAGYEDFSLYGLVVGNGHVWLTLAASASLGYTYEMATATLGVSSLTFVSMRPPAPELEQLSPALLSGDRWYISPLGDLLFATYEAFTWIVSAWLPVTTGSGDPDLLGFISRISLSGEVVTKRLWFREDLGLRMRPGTLHATPYGVAGLGEGLVLGCTAQQSPTDNLDWPFPFKNERPGVVVHVDLDGNVSTLWEQLTIKGGPYVATPGGEVYMLPRTGPPTTW